MSKSAQLRVRDVRAIFHLVGECRDLGDDPAAWQQHRLKSLARLTGAALATSTECVGFWAGQRVFANPFSWGWDNGLDQDAWLRGLATFKDHPTFSLSWDRYEERLRQEEGVAFARSDLVSVKEWESPAEYWAGLRPMGVNHTMTCARSLPGAGDVLCETSLWRAAGERDYTPRDRARLREACAVFVPLIGGPLARPAEPSPSELAPRVRQVLRCLLEGDGDKQTAARLGLSRFTVNQYTKTIFQHFGVQSRPELLARWVRRGWGARFAWADGP